jgi:creatinine amidohydrolase
VTSSDSVRLAERSWTDVERALDDGVGTAIVGVGAIEQHGPHLPMNMDTIDADETARRIAAELGDALAAPSIRPGCSEHHIAFPGTISLREETLRAVVEDYCKSLDSHGFEHVVLVPTHGGNFEPVDAAIADIAEDLEANLIALTDLDRHMELLNAGLASAGVDYHEPVIHAGAAETSMVLATEPDLVRTDRLDVGLEGEISTDRLLEEGFDSIAPNGVLGDPRKATAAAGEAIFELVTDAYVEEIRAERGKAATDSEDSP